MAARFDPTDPRLLTPEQRIDELAAVLAKGVRRTGRPNPAPTPPPHNPPDSSRNCLDESPESRLSVPRG